MTHRRAAAARFGLAGALALALLACATSAPVEPPRSPRVVVGADEHGQTVAFVTAVSPEAAERGRKGLLALYARVAEGAGDWGFRIAPEWREESPEVAIAAIGQSGSPEAIGEFMGAERAWFLDVTYLAAPVANDDGLVYSAAEVIPPTPTLVDEAVGEAAGEEN